LCPNLVGFDLETIAKEALENPLKKADFSNYPLRPIKNASKYSKIGDDQSSLTPEKLFEHNLKINPILAAYGPENLRNLETRIKFYFRDFIDLLSQQSTSGFKNISGHPVVRSTTSWIPNFCPNLVRNVLTQ
jgi:hypothetical protein